MPFEGALDLSIVFQEGLAILPKLLRGSIREFGVQVTDVVNEDSQGSELIYWKAMSCFSCQRQN